MEPDWLSERSKKFIWPDWRWRSDLICSSKSIILIKSGQRSEKPSLLIWSDGPVLQFPIGYSDGNWLRPIVYSHYITFIYL